MSNTPLANSTYRFSKDAEFVTALTSQLATMDKTAPARLFFERLTGNYSLNSLDMTLVGQTAAEFFDRAIDITNDIPGSDQGGFKGKVNDVLYKHCSDEDRKAFKWMAERNDPQLGRRSFMRGGLVLLTTALIAGGTGARATLKPISKIADANQNPRKAPATQPGNEADAQWRDKYQKDMQAIINAVDTGSVIALVGGAFAMVGLMTHHVFQDIGAQSKFTHADKEQMAKDILFNLDDLFEATLDVQRGRQRDQQSRR